MDPPEDGLARAERQVREAEARATRQAAVVEEMKRDGHPRAAAMGREVLATLRWSLELARDHLRIARAARGPGP